MAAKPALLYARVSRGWTHRRGPEIEDQQRLCGAYAARNGFRIVEEYLEIEYGKGTDALESRPLLAACIERSVAEGLPILVLRLDRVTRNVNFLAQLLARSATFIVTGPDGEGGARLGPLPMVPRARRALISRRTREGLRARREKGLTLGNTVNLAEASAAGRRAIVAKADRFAVEIAPTIARLRAGGARSLRSVADELNRRGVPTARRGRWTSTAVKRVLDRAGRLAPETCGVSNE